MFQASLLHNLLSIASLQSYVLSEVLPVIAEVAYTARYSNILNAWKSVFNSNLKPNIGKYFLCYSSQEEIDKLVSILSQMKWLPNVAELKSLSNIILDMVTSATPLAQKEMVRFLPDILPEKQHSKVAETLK